MYMDNHYHYMANIVPEMTGFGLERKLKYDIINSTNLQFKLTKFEIMHNVGGRGETLGKLMDVMGNEITSPTSMHSPIAVINPGGMISFYTVPLKIKKQHSNMYITKIRLTYTNMDRGIELMLYEDFPRGAHYGGQFMGSMTTNRPNRYHISQTKSFGYDPMRATRYLSEVKYVITPMR